MSKTPEQKAADAAAKEKAKADAQAAKDAEKAAAEAQKEADAKAKADADAAAKALADAEGEAATPSAPGAPSKAEFQKIIDAYKLSNPVKYELKKDELAKKLAAFK